MRYSPTALLLVLLVPPAVADPMVTPGAQAARSEAPVPSYTLTWTGETFPELQVDAHIPIDQGRLQTSDFWDTFFDDPRGWAGFVTIQSARSPTGDMLDVRRGEANQWRVGDGYSGTAILRYTVDFSFAERPWPAGNEQVALAVDGALYTTGLPVFVYGTAPERVQVRFVVPDGWHVATAWPKIGNDVFLARDLDRLTRNTLAIGRFQYEVFHAGSFELRLALLGGAGRSGDLVRETFQGLFDYYRDLYAPDDVASFMIAVLPGPNDGEAYFDSFASSTPDPPTMANRLIWANSLAHEFGHYWNGKRFSTTFEHRDERQWFSEGGSEYVALLAMRHAGIMDERTYRETLARYLTVHLLFATSPRFDGVTLREAGASKWPYRPGVYDSGVVASFCLDGLIREHSDGTRTFGDMLRLMNHRFGDTATPYTFDDLVDAASEAAGRSLTTFFETHITGDAPLPVQHCAERMGYTALIDGYHVYLR